VMAEELISFGLVLTNFNVSVLLCNISLSFWCVRDVAFDVGGEGQASSCRWTRNGERRA
jgi:hypothetical protein